MTSYENDPRVTRLSDDEYHANIENSGAWRIYREGGRWYSESPTPLPFQTDRATYEHPSKETAFESILGDRSTIVLPNGF
jgi:hypothetical protein